MERWRDAKWINEMTVSLDYSNMMSDYISDGRGISKQEIDGLAARAVEISDGIEVRKKGGEFGFYRLPYDSDNVNAALNTAGLYQGKYEDFVVLGIGGSALGGSALFQAFCHPQHNLLSSAERNGLPRIFYLDNIDPGTFKGILGVINFEKTLFNIISLSGATTETISQFLIIHQILANKIGEDNARENIVVTTGAGQGSLRIIAEERGYRLLTIPANVGGRFSVFSPVGLFPSAIAGIDIEELLAGARYMEERCRGDEIWKNPAHLSAALYYLADVKKGFNISVMMPYSDALVKTAYWFRQLWAESLGKEKNTNGDVVNVGPTPVVSVGVTDQHSQLQLYLEGPYNKFITFLTVEKTGESIPVPPLTGEADEFEHLSKHNLGEILTIEAETTRFALAEAGRSNMVFILPEVNPFTIGQLMFWLQEQTIFAAGLYNINPVGQPGVEASKRYIYGALGRSGFEDEAVKISEWRNNEIKYIV